jgi:hypothetical protein
MAQSSTPLIQLAATDVCGSGFFSKGTAVAEQELPRRAFIDQSSMHGMNLMVRMIM